ncbi:MAG: hypothetical protein K2K55_05795, partial [Duncaniella sp.]|nr:hypothetical protein [Duncaniella sp.]
MYKVLCLSIVVGLTACQDDVKQPETVGTGDANTIVLQGSITVPDMPVITSRGALAETSGADLKLTIFEFDLGENTSNSFLSDIYKAEITAPTTAVDNGTVVNFKVTLKSNSKPKVLHLVLADEYLTWPFAPVSDILAGLTVGSIGNETEAYWGRVEFPKGYNELNEDGTFKTDEDGKPVLLEDVEKNLTEVPLIRNFAAISVTVSNDVENFHLIGFDVVNIPTSGTVAPWNPADQTIPALLGADKKMQNYADVSKIYSGILPAGAQLRNTETDAKTWNESTEALNNTETVYMYEHPYEASRRTYLIVKGEINVDGNWQPGYYKLDIGVIKEDGTFDYYNIIRNIRYNIVIKEVRAPGAASVGEAIERAPFNNLIAATETSSMLNVSDGQNMLIVNDTNHIIVKEGETVRVLYRYLENVTAATPTPNNSGAKVVGLERGAVIADFQTTTYRDEAGADWVEIDITPNPPTSVVQTQDFTIVDDYGLGRTIHLILRKPWQYAPLKNKDGSDSKWQASVAPGISNSFPFTESITTPDPQPISTEIQQPLTVYFNLPDGLPESMFPLEFTLEALYQGIENNKIGTLVVTSGPSMFPENNGAIAIQYELTLIHK